MKNFKMKQDFHTHTINSDGKGTIEDNVKAAIAAGLTDIGITDHGFNHRMCGITHEKVKAMREEINRLKDIYPINIWLGVEANLISLNGDLDLTPEDVKLFDYIIFGIHYTGFSDNLKDKWNFGLRNFLLKTKGYMDKVTESYIKAMQKYPIKIVVHPNYVARVDIKRLAEGAAENNVLIELNAKYNRITEDELKEALKTNVKFVVSSDAHTPNRVAECSMIKELLSGMDFPSDRIVNIKMED